VLVVWLSLVLALLLVASATFMATSRGIQLFRDFKRLGSGIEQELRRIERASGHIQLHLDAAARSGDELHAATARLSRSRAKLNVLLAAIADVRAAIGLVTAFAPRK
jgi:hypothetical protein